jgi:hypothetical protein
MDRFYYSGFLTLFLVPLIFFVITHYRKSIKKRKRLIEVMAVIGFFSFLLMMPIAAQWGAWHYDYSKTWNIRIGYELLETWIWQIISCILLAIVVDSLATQDEKRQHFVKKRKK